MSLWNIRNLLEKEQTVLNKKMERGETMREIFQTIAGNVGMSYSQLLQDEEFRNAVDKILQSDEYKEEHDAQTIKIAEGLKNEQKTENS